MIRMAFALLMGALTLISMDANAADRWSSYDNARYSYRVAIPPGFSAVQEADNGDGGVSVSEDGSAELRVWGSNILDGTFADEAASRITSDRSDGWEISYEVTKPKSASWSGTRNGKVFYQRAIAGCDQTAVFFRLDYDAADIAAFDAIVGRLVKSLKSGC